MLPNGETPEVEAESEVDPRDELIEQLHKAVEVAQKKELDYQILCDAANNLLIVVRRAGPLTVQESWDPVFARQVAEGVLSQLDQLATDRKAFEAEMQRVRRESGPGGPRLWTPGADGGPPPGVHPGMNRADRRAAARS